MMMFMRSTASPLPLHRLIMTATFTAFLMVMMITACSSADASAEQERDGSGGCSGHACPARVPSAAQRGAPECGLWLGPSPIKEAYEHGFGLGVFTGQFLPKGASIEHELLVPIYDSLLHDEDHHPPLREYVWNADNAPEVALESRRGSFLFMSGLAGIAPCTDKNYNLELTGRGDFVGTSRHNIIPDSAGVHRAFSPMAGAFSYRHNVSYTAVRDIVAGEELTVQCNDDDFDGGAYYMSKYSSDDNSNAFVCVDNSVRVAPSLIGGQGLFAKHDISPGSVITSTPVIPIDRKELVMKSKNKKDDGKKKKDVQQQLLLNYCFGHPRSDLLLLPYGPLVNYMNHAPPGKTANAVIRWHPVTEDNSNDVLPRRQQHHHPELFQESAKTVARTHGKGLMMDIVALRPIAADEELYLDYGAEWEQAYNAHMRQWQVTEDDRQYISAADYARTHDLSVIRTAAEQKTNPYPKNLETVCFWDEDDDEVSVERSAFCRFVVATIVVATMVVATMEPLSHIATPTL